MKSTAVQYPSLTTLVFLGLARSSPRYGHAAYLLSLALAGAAFAGSVFYNDIVRTFGSHVLGVRAVAVWQGAFALAAVAWLVAMALGVFCLPKRGRLRALGLSSIGMNLAAALLVACTLM